MPVKESSTEISARIRQSEAKPLAVGIEFDQARITAVLLDENARLIAERQTETPQRTTRATVAALSKSVLELAASKERGDSPIIAIGLAVPGVIDPPSGRVTIVGMKGWTRVPLSQMLEESLDESGHDIRTPIHEKRARAQHTVSAHPLITIHSRVAANAAAESWHGAARGKTSVVYLSIGAEFEVGILANGRPLMGASGNAGAAGWMAVGENFRDEYETNGCLAAEAAIKAITRRAIEGWDGQTNSMLSSVIQQDVSQLDAATVIRAARGGDKLAVKVIGDTCRWIGRGVANLISTLNPEVVVIGGELGLPLKAFLDDVREESRRWAAPEAARQCRIVSATVGEKAAVIGAARLALTQALPKEGK